MSIRPCWALNVWRWSWGPSSLHWGTFKTGVPVAQTHQTLHFYWTHSNENKKLELWPRSREIQNFSLRQVFFVWFLWGSARPMLGPQVSLFHRRVTEQAQAIVCFIYCPCTQPMKPNQNQLERYCLSCEWQITLPSWTWEDRGGLSVLLLPRWSSTQTFFVCEGESFCR